ncbi:MAG: LysM peptidoglycan-binding domain-containing protein [Candidatus Shapirobacteria bacterium]
MKLNEVNVSTLLGLIVILVIGAIVVNFFRQGRSNSSGQADQTAADQTEESNLTNAELEPDVYTVQTDDTLWKIAQEYYHDGYAWTKIAQENQLADPNLLSAGQKLTIPAADNISGGTSDGVIEGSSYIVVGGDNLWEIALRAYGDGFRWTEIAQINNLANPGLIHPGNELTLPR